MLDVVVRTPIPSGGGFFVSLGDKISGYSHTINSEGGFTDATITIVSNDRDAGSWIQNGVGQHVVSSFGGLIVWEGLIDSVDVVVGNNLFSRGPLMDVVNKARVTWQQHTFGGLISGGQRITDFENDAGAQVGFYILEGDIAGGTLVSDDEATSIRDLYLSENSRPQSRIDFSGSGSVAVTLNCVGYFRLLEKYYYLKAVDNPIESTEKIKAVLEADPNNIFNGDRGYFETIGITVNEYEDWSRTASDIIFELSSLGNADGNRMNFGVYEYRTPSLKAVEKGITYEMSSGANGSIITMRNGGPIPLELVRPGNWIRSRSIPVAARTGTNIDVRQSERDVLIESVTFQLPNQLSINGGAFDTFAQRLARYNFGLA